MNGHSQPNKKKTKKLAANVRILIGFTLMPFTLAMVFGLYSVINFEDSEPFGIGPLLTTIAIGLGWYVVLTGRDLLSEMG